MNRGRAFLDEGGKAKKVGHMAISLLLGVVAAHVLAGRSFHNLISVMNKYSKPSIRLRLSHCCAIFLFYLVREI